MASLAGAVSAVMAVCAFGSIRAAARPMETAALRIVAISCLVQFAAAFAWVKFFDRYALILLPPALLVFALCAGAGVSPTPRLKPAYGRW